MLAVLEVVRGAAVAAVGVGVVDHALDGVRERPLPALEAAHQALDDAGGGVGGEAKAFAPGRLVVWDLDPRALVLGVGHAGRELRLVDHGVEAVLGDQGAGHLLPGGGAGFPPLPAPAELQVGAPGVRRELRPHQDRLAGEAAADRGLPGLAVDRGADDAAGLDARDRQAGGHRLAGAGGAAVAEADPEQRPLPHAVAQGVVVGAGLVAAAVHHRLGGVGVQRRRRARPAVVEVEVRDLAGAGDGQVLVESWRGVEGPRRALLEVDHLPLAGRSGGLRPQRRDAEPDQVHREDQAVLAAEVADDHGVGPGVGVDRVIGAAVPDQLERAEAADGWALSGEDRRAAAIDLHPQRGGAAGRQDQDPAMHAAALELGVGDSGIAQRSQRAAGAAAHLRRHGRTGAGDR